MKAGMKWALAGVTAIGLGLIGWVGWYESQFEYVDDVDEPDDQEINRIQSTAKGKANAFISALLQYLGAPYTWGGATSKQAGLDCSGFAYRGARDISVTIPRTSKNQAAACRYVSEEVAKNTAGAFVFYAKKKGTQELLENASSIQEKQRIAKEQGIFHIAVSMGDGRVIESQCHDAKCCTTGKPCKGGVMYAKWGWWQRKYDSIYGIMPQIEVEEYEEEE